MWLCELVSCVRVCDVLHSGSLCVFGRACGGVCVCGWIGTSQRVIGFEAVLVVLSACVQDMCALGWYVTAVHCGCV